MASLSKLMKSSKKVAKALENLTQAHTLKLQSNEKKAAGQEVILPLMREHSIKSEKVSGLNLTYVNGGTQNNFDKKLAKELLLEWGFDKEVIDHIWAEASKESKKAEALRVS